MLKNDIEIILCETSHPGNIGATARAMKNMALNRLVLVSPKQFPHSEAFDRASGADDILQQAKIVKTLKEALSESQWVYGASARGRALMWPVVSPKEMAEKVCIQHENPQKIAIVFGNEQSGLSNEDLQLCDYHVVIPANPLYSSLNLAQAVQVITYEIYQASLKEKESVLLQQAPKATKENIAQLLSHFAQVAEKIDFMDPKNPKKLIPKMQKLLNKAQLEEEEVNILRGFFRHIEMNLRQ